MKVIKQRIDFFIVFSNGLQYSAEILNIIRADKGFEILYIQKRQAHDREKFVNDLYSCDTVPLEHLRGKTKYLLDHTPDYLFILAKNKMPDERYFGEGEFRHIQCRHVVNLKNYIRDLYNPRNKDGSRTEHHVIHASDYESQTRHVLDMLGLPDIWYFTRVPNPDFNLKYFTQPFDKYEIKTVSFDDLIFRNGQERVHIKDLLHYRYLTGDTRPYLDYMHGAMGVLDCDDHNPEAFKTLLQNFHYRKENYILAYRDGDKYLVNDGNHRGAILYYSGRLQIPIVVPEPFSDLLPLEKFFNEFDDNSYVILRRKEWLPHYYHGEDIDILTGNYEAFAAKVLTFLNENSEGFTVEIMKKDGHHYIDVYFDDLSGIHLRFDIITEITGKKFKVNENYSHTLMGRTMRIRRNEAMLRVPNPIDDLITRYFEWADNPQKEKHLQYVKERADAGFFSELANASNLPIKF